MSIDNDPWNDFETEITTAPNKEMTVVRLEPLATEYAKLKQEHDALSDRLGQLENEIAYLFPEEAGEIAQSTPAYEVIVSRTERWQWDKVALEKMFSPEELPDYVKRSITVDKRKFQKLPAQEQERLKFALTRKLDNPKVKVIPNV